MEAIEIIRCKGHPLVSARHPTTFEITTEEHLTEYGHCIIGVEAEKGARDLSEEFRHILCHDDATLTTVLACGAVMAEVRSQGSAALTLDHPTDLVWRKSRFTCGRTVGILSDTVAADLPQELVNCLRERDTMVVTMTVRRPG